MVTYKNPQCVHNNLTTLFDTLTRSNAYASIDITIINNHSQFYLDPKWNQYVKVVNNMRLDNSCGHLSRDWNYAIMDGFRSLKSPQCDQVICVHDDVLWTENWLEKLFDIHKTYNHYMGDFGCTIQSYLPDAIKRIGLWDERFINIGYHEADYQLRARIYNTEKSSINDYEQGRVWNPTDILVIHPPHNHDKSVASNESYPYHPLSRLMFEKKWRLYPERWEKTGVLTNPPVCPYVEGYMFYPYFERDVETLSEQRYMQAWEFHSKWHDPLFTTDRAEI